LKGLKQLKKPFLTFIAYLFKRGTSAFIIILGRRETGKTDFALLIAEILASKGIIKHFATNIKIYNAPFIIRHVTNLDDLREWSEETKGPKLFIFDEFGKSMRRRSPMSSLNVQLIDEFQILRKHKLSVIAITVNEKYADTAVLGSDVLDGYFSKPNYKNQKVAIYVDLLEGFSKGITGIPPTSIDFDTWDVAPFREHGKDAKPKFKDKDLNILWEWSHGKTYKDVGLHKMQINRLVRKFIRQTLEKTFHKSHA